MREMPTLSILLIVAGIAATSCAAKVVKIQPEPLEGVICQPPDCVFGEPRQVGDLQQADRELIGVVKNIPVSVLDLDLRGVTFEQWLSDIFGPYIEPPRSWVANWDLSFCEDRGNAVPGVGADLCVEVSVPISPSKTVVFVIAVAENDPARGDSAWSQHTPSIRDIFIEHRQDGAPDSLDVARLSALVSQLQVPPANEQHHFESPEYKNVFAFQIWSAVHDFRTSTQATSHPTGCTRGIGSKA
jgi:hypothetical protein